MAAMKNGIKSRWLRLLPVLVVALQCAACVGNRYMVLPEDLVTMDAKIENHDVGSLRRGMVISQTECVDCHRIYWPAEFSADRWQGIARKMGRRAGLDRRQVEDMRFYLQSASRNLNRPGA